MLGLSEQKAAMPGIRIAALSLVVTSLLGLASGYAEYLSKIPNGHRVPNPCSPQETWKGVGHIVRDGGGARNPFGQDFAKEGLKWGPGLCRKDSDGDGMSNGQELGDPDCVWKEGKTPNRTTGISHPGVCDPLNSADCKQKNTDIRCFDCPGIKNKVDVNPHILKFPETTVPAQETTYICQGFKLPADDTYHLVATEPVIDNARVMHHMVLFGCNEGYEMKKKGPFSCLMPPKGCRNMIALWTVGSPGQCLPDNVGFRVGKTGFKAAYLQFHWNNPKLTSGLKDSSAMKLYLTNKTRENDAGMLLVGQTDIAIPPRATNYCVRAALSPTCTKQKFKKDFNVAIGWNHMHLLGRSMRVELFRDGIKKADLAYDKDFDYNSPKEHLHTPPLLVKRGDEIRTTCVYSSSSPNYTYFGDATSDEMCFGFITYYPKDAIDEKDMFMTNTESGDPCRENSGCGINDLIRDFSSQVTPKCKALSSCQCECRTAFRKFRQHRCLQGLLGGNDTKILREEIRLKKASFPGAKACPEELQSLLSQDCHPVLPSCSTHGVSSAGPALKGVLSPLLLLSVGVAVPPIFL